MSDLILYQEQKVKSTGINPWNQINEDKLKGYFLGGDYKKLSLLDSLPKLSLPSAVPVLFYPGCGVDIFFPLIYLEKLFPAFSQVKMYFNDLDNTLGTIKACLNEVGINFSVQKNQLQFYWQDLLIELTFIHGDMVKVLDSFSSFDIYFERALRIFREKYPDYERQVFSKLKSGGVLISDSGYTRLPLQILPASSSLSSYGEMIIGIK